MRRALAVALLAVSVSACASDPSTIASGPTTSMPAEATTPQPGVVRSSSTTMHARTVVGSTPSTGSRPASPTTQLPPLGGAGTEAPHYLRASRSSAIVLQVLTQSGAEPRQGSIDHLVSNLEQVSGKPVTVTGGTLPSSSATWTDASLEAEGASRQPSVADGVALMQYLFVHGTYRGDDSVLGLTVTGDLTAIFSDQVTGAASGLATPGHIEESVTTHELGHLLGLVDLFLHTGRADPQHPGHSRNPKSVMYWAVESSVVTDLLTGGPPTEFDAADRADLATIRGDG